MVGYRLCAGRLMEPRIMPPWDQRFMDQMSSISVDTLRRGGLDLSRRTGNKKKTHHEVGAPQVDENKVTFGNAVSRLDHLKQFLSSQARRLRILRRRVRRVPRLDAAGLLCRCHLTNQCRAIDVLYGANKALSVLEFFACLLRTATLPTT